MRMTVKALALSLGLVTSGAALAAETPSFSYGGTTYSGETLPAGVRKSLHELEQQMNSQRQQVLDTYVANRYLDEEASRQGKSLEQLQQELLSVPQPSDEQVKSFYEANRARIPVPLEQARQNIANYLSNQASLEKQRELMARIASEKGYQVSLPELPVLRLAVVTDGYPTKGNPQAPVTLVEFADYQCPHCKQAVPVVSALLERFGDSLRVVYRDFPINASGKSRKVAEAAVCADRQGQFWPFHELAFERQSYLGSIEPGQLADELGLDRAAFDACFEDAATAARVETSYQEARELGLNSTPSFLVNGRPLSHNHGDLGAALAELIEAELDAES